MIQALPSSSPSELSVATNLAHRIPILFNASKAPMGETKRVLMMCCIDQILMHLSRFGPSVIQVLSDNNSPDFWIDLGIALEYLLYQQTLSDTHITPLSTQALDSLFGSSTIPVSALSLHQLFLLVNSPSSYSILHSLYELTSRAPPLILKATQVCSQPQSLQRIISYVSSPLKRSLSSLSMVSHSTTGEDEEEKPALFGDDFLNHVSVYEQNRGKDIAQLLRSLKKNESSSQSTAIKHASISRSYAPSITDSSISHATNPSSELNETMIVELAELAESVTVLQKIVTKASNLEFGELSYPILKEVCSLLVEYCHNARLCSLLWETSGLSGSISQTDVIRSIFLLLGSTDATGFNDCASFFALGCVLLSFFQEYQGDIVPARLTRKE